MSINTLQLLRSKFTAFCELPEMELQEIMHFSILWSFFEAKVLDMKASSDKIKETVITWKELGQLDLETSSNLLKNLDYFKGRYFRSDGTPTEHFERFEFRSSKEKGFIEKILKGRQTNLEDSVSALLIIAYRFRNNLFHGNKWKFELRDQFDNFKILNSILISALEIHRVQ